MGMTDKENANRGSSKSSSSKSASSKSTPSKSTPSNSDGRGSQRDQVKSAQAAKSSMASKSNSDGRGSQREQVRSAQQAKSLASDGRGSQRDQRTSALADKVGKSLSSIGQSITGKIRDVNSGTMMQSINSFTAGLTGKDPAASTRAGVKTGLKGNAGIIADTLASLGRKPHEIAGMLGRLTEESQLNPNAIRKNDNKKYRGELAHSIGIGQWNGTRQQALKEFAAKKGTDWNDLATQAEFMDHELKTSPDEKRAREAMARATTPAEAAEAMMHYERPYGYSPKNPTAGLGWSKTKSTALSYGSELGDFTADSVAATPASLGAKKGTASYAIGEALGKAFGGMFDDSQGTLSGGGDAPAEVASASGYRDPSVSTPAGRKARGEADYTPRTQADVPASRRGGFGLLEVGLKEDDPLKVGRSVVGAVMNPVGFMLDSIQDSVRQSPEWNSEGPEGEPVSGIGERISNFFNSSTVDQSYRKEGGNKTGLGSGNSGSQDRQKDSQEQQAPVAAAPVTPAPTSSVDLYAQLLAQLNAFSLDTTPTDTRKPYDWSTL